MSDRASVIRDIRAERGDGRRGVIAPIAGGGDPLAITRWDNPLAEGWRPELDGPARRLVIFSGTLAERLFEPHPFNWLVAGHEAIDRWCARWAGPLREAGRVACLVPHARHVLSDAPAARRFLEAHAGEPFEVALAPAMMLERRMLDDLEDHLRRQIAMLGPSCALVLLEDVRLSGDEVVRVPLGQGLMPPALLRSLLEAHVPAATPLVVRGPEPADEARWLAGGAGCRAGPQPLQ